MQMFVFVSDRRKWFRCLGMLGNGNPGGFIYVCWDHCKDDYLVLEQEDVLPTENIKFFSDAVAKGLQHP